MFTVEDYRPLTTKDRTRIDQLRRELLSCDDEDLEDPPKKEQPSQDVYVTGSVVLLRGHQLCPTEVTGFRYQRCGGGRRIVKRGKSS